MGGESRTPATARVTTAPDLGPDGRRLVIDCRHGTSTVSLIVPPGADPGLADPELLALALDYHEAAEGCGCAHDLAALAVIEPEAVA